MRTNKDCVLITAQIAKDLNANEQALLLGLLFGEYSKHPESKFWDVVLEFAKLVTK